MALCSLAFNGASNKRSCSFANDGAKTKKICLTKNIESKTNTKTKTNTNFLNNKIFYSPVASSSESEEDSEDEQSCYNANQIKAKRRASSRVSFSLNRNSELSKAISKYSDDDEEDLPSDKGSHDDNIDCKLLSSPANSSILSCSNTNLNNQLLSGNNSAGNNFLQISDNSTCQNLKKSIPESDKNSRSRCFEYLVSSIDEAWARYCDATTYVEDEVYGYNTPASIATDDEDYFGNLTDLTDYESDYEISSKQQANVRKLSTPITPNHSAFSTLASSSSLSSSKDPSSCQLQALKDRLTKAKYFLQDLVDSDDFNDAVAFWKRWDMVKYATIELVEDDDDDEVVESTIDELEDGRLFSN